MMTTDRNLNNSLHPFTPSNVLPSRRYIKFLPSPGPESSLASASDAILLQNFKCEDCRESFGTLFQRYSHLVLGICIKYLKHAEESKDAVMDIFIELMEKIRRSEIRNFKAWLFQVVKNHCLMRLRKRYETATEDFNSILVPEGSPEHPGYDKELLRISMRLISPAQKQCLELFYLEGYRYKEIVQITGFSMKEVKSHLQNGRRMLEKNMRRSA